MTENTMAVAANEESRGKRKLIVAAGAAGLLVLGAAGYLLLSGGGSSNDASFAPPAHHVQAPKSSATLRSHVPAVRRLPAASQVRIGRDPFSALYVVPVAAPAGASGSSTGTPATTPTGSPTAGTGTTSTGATTPTTARYVLVLKAVTRDPGGAYLFNFTVDSTPKTVLPAQRFGKYGELVVLTYVKNSKGAVTGAVVQVGDDSPIAVPIGAKVSVL
jgi:hypothetical protein